MGYSLQSTHPVSYYKNKNKIVDFLRRFQRLVQIFSLVQLFMKNNPNLFFLTGGLCTFSRICLLQNFYRLTSVKMSEKLWFCSILGPFQLDKLLHKPILSLAKSELMNHGFFYQQFGERARVDYYFWSSMKKCVYQLLQKTDEDLPR